MIVVGLNRQSIKQTLSICFKLSCLRLTTANLHFNIAEAIWINTLYKMDQEFQCPFCDNYFQKASYLKNHIKRLHEKQQMDCSLCELNFGNKYDLKRHVITVHLKEKNHQCPFCLKSFGRLYNRNRHIKFNHNANFWKSSKFASVSYCLKLSYGHIKKKHIKMIANNKSHARIKMICLAFICTN